MVRRRPPIFATICLALLLCGGTPAVAQEGARDEAIRAAVLWQRGYAMHVLGRYDAAIDLFGRSIELHPTAEAHTFRGWSLSHTGRIAEAIAECKKAIPLDPEFGNPYNDIGVYLSQLGRADEAIPWLRKAMRARRYCCYQFPHFNLGRILFGKGDFDGAEREFRKALDFDPEYLPAKQALEALNAHAPKL